jgi:hypothetical protein
VDDSYKISQIAPDVDLERIRICRDHAKRAVKELELISYKLPELDTAPLPWRAKLLGLPLAINMTQVVNLVLQLWMTLDKAFVFRSPIPSDKKLRKLNKKKKKQAYKSLSQVKKSVKRRALPRAPTKTQPARVLLKRSSSEE